MIPIFTLSSAFLYYLSLLLTVFIILFPVFFY